MLMGFNGLLESEEKAKLICLVEAPFQDQEVSLRVLWKIIL